MIKYAAALLIFMTALGQAQAKTSLKEIWHERALTKEKKLRFFLHLKRFYLENHELLSAPSEELKKTTLFRIFTQAYSDENSDCFYGGFPSKRVRVSATRSLCDRPARTSDRYRVLANQYKCGDTNKFLCNPALFGLGADNQGICLPIRTASQVANITANCEQALQNELEKIDGDLNSYLVEKLGSQEEPFYSEWIRALEVLDGQKNCPERLSWCRLIRGKVEDLVSALESDLGPPGNDEAITVNEEDVDDEEADQEEIAEEETANEEESDESITLTRPPLTLTPNSGFFTSEQSTDENVPTTTMTNGARSASLATLEYVYEEAAPGSAIRSLEGFPGHISTHIKAPFAKLGEKAFGQSHFGYGFLHAESEKKAIEAVNFSCDQDSMEDYEKGVCSLASFESSNPSSQEALNMLSAPLYVERVQKSVYEYLALQLRSSGRSVGERPQCVSEEFYQQIQGLPERLPVDSQDLGLKVNLGSFPEEDNRLLNKFGAVGQMNSLEKGLRQIFMIKHYERALEENLAPHDREEREERLSFLKQSSPYYQGTSSEQRALIMSNLYKLLGDGRESAGREIFQEADLSGSRGFNHFVDSIQEKLIGSPERRQALVQSLESAKEAGLAKAERALGSLCRTSADELLQEYPQAARQMLADGSEIAPVLKHQLCQKRFFTQNTQTSEHYRDREGCYELERANSEIQRADSMTIARPDAYRTIRIPDDSSAPVEVELVLPVEIATGNFAGENLQGEKFQNMMMQWQDSLNSYFNQEARNFTENHNGETLPRPVRFNIQVQPAGLSSRPALVNLYECFDHDYGNSCSEIIENAYQACLAAPSANENEKRQRCADVRGQYLRDYRAGRLENLPQRLNSASFTPRVSETTLRHEVAHLLGAHDEYEDGVYRSVASDNSLMGMGERLHRRHFDEFAYKYTRCW